jgi:hypothetical protein
MSSWSRWRCKIPAERLSRAREETIELYLSSPSHGGSAPPARAMYAPRCTRLVRDGCRVLSIGMARCGKAFIRNTLRAGCRRNRRGVVSSRS